MAASGCSGHLPNWLNFKRLIAQLAIETAKLVHIENSVSEQNEPDVALWKWNNVLVDINSCYITENEDRRIGRCHVLLWRNVRLLVVILDCVLDLLFFFHDASEAHYLQTNAVTDATAAEEICCGRNHTRRIRRTTGKASA